MKLRAMLVLSVSLAGAACVALPAATQEDLLVPRLGACAGTYRGFALSPDAGTVAWTSDGNLNLYDLATSNTQSYAAGALSESAPPSFSPDGRFVTGPLFTGDGNYALYMLDTLAQTFGRVNLPSDCTSIIGWTAPSDALATVCQDFSVLVFDPVHLDAGPVMQVAPPDLGPCRHVGFIPVGKVDAVGQQVALLCGGFDGPLAVWSYAGGTSHAVSTIAIGTPGPNPILAYPNVNVVNAVDVSATRPGEVLVAGLNLFTADAANGFEPMRMLSPSFTTAAQYSADGSEVVAVVNHGYDLTLQAWRLDDGPNPYFVSTAGERQAFSISHNGVLGACDSGGNFRVWHLHR